MEGGSEALSSENGFNPSLTSHVSWDWNSRLEIGFSLSYEHIPSLSSSLQSCY